MMIAQHLAFIFVPRPAFENMNKNKRDKINSI